MEFFTPIKPERSSSIGMALVVSSPTPLLLLNEHLAVTAASQTFCASFDLDCETIVGKTLFEMGDGEWKAPQLRLLLEATASGKAEIDAYEYTLKRPGQPDRALILHAHVLDHVGEDALQLVLAVSDITAIRDADRALQAASDRNESLAKEKLLLLQELNHRVANSLQIIASIMMQRVRNVHSDETRGHLRDAHHRVMSIAKLQRLLASNDSNEVKLGPYLTDLCASIGASMIADPEKLSLVVSADDSMMNPEQSVSLGLIVTELAINSLKHAFPDANQTGRIEVTFASSETGWLLTVADDGIGLPKDHAGAKPGLGTGIVNALANQLVAEVAVTDADPGTTVTVTHTAKAGTKTEAVAAV
ncbi:MAG: sensor histidine kinase [Novosphingobium sp.]